MDSVAHYICKTKEDNMKICFLKSTKEKLFSTRGEKVKENSQSEAKQHSNMKDIKWGIVAFASSSHPCVSTSLKTPIFLLPCRLQLFLPLFC
jgi:hypothetical protein